MAVFCLAVVLLVLGIAAALSLPQWGEDSVIPEVSVVPHPGVGLDDAVAVSPPQQLAVAPAHLAGVEGPRLAVSVGVGAAGDSAVRAGLAAAEVVAVARPVSPPVDLPQPAPPTPAPPQSAPAPVAAPVSAPAPTPVVAPTRPDPGSQPPPPNPAGGPGPTGVVVGPVQVHEGDEYAYSFSFYIQPDAYRAPGEDNLILRIGGEIDQSHSLGLQLWDDGSGAQRGLWASGDAMDGERFLTPVSEGAWHEVVLYFQASSEDDGLYLLMLDGAPIDTRAWVSLIDSAGGYGLLEAGLFREGERVDGAPEIYFGPARLSETLESVIP